QAHLCRTSWLDVERQFEAIPPHFGEVVLAVCLESHMSLLVSMMAQHSQLRYRVDEQAPICRQVQHPRQAQHPCPAGSSLGSLGTRLTYPTPEQPPALAIEHTHRGVQLTPRPVHVSVGFRIIRFVLQAPQVILNPGLMAVEEQEVSIA